MPGSGPAEVSFRALPPPAPTEESSAPQSLEHDDSFVSTSSPAGTNGRGGEDDTAGEIARASSSDANGGKRKRTMPSCTNCYNRKIKCLKEQPVCSGCIKRKTSNTCYYVDRREAGASELPPPRKASSHGHRRVGPNHHAASASQSFHGHDSPDVSGIAPSGASIDLRDMSSDQMEKIVNRIATMVADKLQSGGGGSSSASPSSSFNQGKLVQVSVPRQFGTASVAPSNDGLLAASQAHASQLSAYSSGGSWYGPVDDTSVMDVLLQLPSDSVIDWAVRFYLAELEPFYTCCNGWILRNQMSKLQAARKQLLSNSCPTQASSFEGPTRAGDFPSPILQSQLLKTVYGSVRRSFDVDSIHLRTAEAKNPSAAPQLDLSVLALLFALLGQVVYALDEREVVEHGFCSDPSERIELSKRYLELSEGILTILLLSTLFYMQFRITAALLMTGAAIRCAAAMGLHRLGSAVEDSMRWQTPLHGKDEVNARELQIAEEAEQTKGLPAWSKPDWHMSKVQEFASGDHARRELGRKVWFGLITPEWAIAPRFDQFYIAQPKLFTTKLPANLTDEMLQDLQPFSVLPPIDAALPTDRAYIETHLLLADVCRRFTDRVSQEGMSHEIAMHADAEVRSILNTLPWFYLFDLPGESGERLKAVMTQRPVTSVQRVLAHEQIWHLLLRLNRSFMGRGFSDPMYAHSTRTCIEAAQFIIAVYDELQRAKSRALNLWYVSIHLFHAAIVLSIDLVHSAAGPITPEIAEKQRAVKSAIESLKSTRMAQPKPGFEKPPLADLIEFSKKEHQLRASWEDRQRQPVQQQQKAQRQHPAAVVTPDSNTSSIGSDSIHNGSTSSIAHPWVSDGGTAGKAPAPAHASTSTTAILQDDFEKILRGFLNMPSPPSTGAAIDDSGRPSNSQQYQQQNQHQVLQQQAYQQQMFEPPSEVHMFLQELFTPAVQM
ncbi:hypothetical protein K437DRAFT_265140 [Tilletiaria anomala UBC 951]|uniref:Zn(2)-C6 fungal-type domain-containing protein n=1 Tax=Tilletiaria anomala (strain ATCC 24038 / CBS 436.72 / UBC 951) TaxID=1037660 RepID=A0A066VEM4_TILAU|nr:uncharacterized protein K437DRAFT_265140 [Tilletiaria anomala UBC 951]KDN37214.1 hypothetical protein K437DRAFT_265140 [Tilletiaria anomala UBC 951]